MFILRATLFGFILLGTLSGTARQQATPLAQGVFLVASEQLHGSSFGETVVLLTRYSRSEGAMGLAINRSTGINLEELFPDVELFKKHETILYAGGPVQPGALLILSLAGHSHAMREIVDDIHFGSGMDNLAELLLSKSKTANVRAYSGYSGWRAGQLEAEINRGDWLVIPAQADAVFNEHPEKVWRRLMQRWSGTWL